jgi:hypothetical protein
VAYLERAGDPNYQSGKKRWLEPMFAHVVSYDMANRRGHFPHVDDSGAAPATPKLPMDLHWG